MGALPSQWRAQDDAAQTERFHQLSQSTSRITVEHPDGRLEEMGGYFRDGRKAYCLLLLRCSDCRDEIGRVWLTPTLHQGSPFAWAELVRVVDREARPVLVREVAMVLDSYTAELLLVGECRRHGERAVSVAAAQEHLPEAAARFDPDKPRSSITALAMPRRVALTDD